MYFFVSNFFHLTIAMRFIHVIVFILPPFIYLLSVCVLSAGAWFGMCKSRAVRLRKKSKVRGGWEALLGDTLLCCHAPTQAVKRYSSSLHLSVCDTVPPTSPWKEGRRRNLFASLISSSWVPFSQSLHHGKPSFPYWQKKWG